MCQCNNHLSLSSRAAGCGGFYLPKYLFVYPILGLHLPSAFCFFGALQLLGALLSYLRLCGEIILLTPVSLQEAIPETPNQAATMGHELL